MTITPETTVRDIAIADPSTTRVCEKLGIDYCCGGRNSLAVACASAKITLEDALGLLSEAAAPFETPAVDWSTRPLNELTAHIVATHHSYVRQDTLRTAALLEKVVRAHGKKHPEIVEIQQIFIALSSELSTHMMKEEHLLFPYIDRLSGASRATGIPGPFFGHSDAPVSCMMAEHDDAGALLAQIRTLSANFAVPDGACPTYRALLAALEEFEKDLHQHVHLENNILFPRALETERKLAASAIN